MDLFWYLIYFVISLTVLVVSADKFVSNSSSLAKNLGVSELTIGLTIIALGTSAPEIFVGISSVINEAESIAMGTVIGSNISNIALIFGVACIGGISAKSDMNLNQIWPFLLSLTVLGISLLNFQVSVAESMLMLLIFLFSIYLIFKYGRNEFVEEVSNADGIYKKPLLLSFIALSGLLIGSYFSVINAEMIAKTIGVPDLIIGLTIVALGTSLPELAATIAALVQRRDAMVVGNILGSNILNIVIVVPIIGLFSYVELDQAIFSRDFLFLVLLSIAFVIIAILKYKKSIPSIIIRISGFILLSLYVIYIFNLSGLI